MKAGTAAVIGLSIAALQACSTQALDPSQTYTQGYVIDEQMLELVPVGSSREQVLLALGTPTTTATFDNETFYYISQTKVRSVAFMRPRVTDRRILAIYLNEEGRVEKIAEYGLQDGKVFDFVSRTTPTGGADQNFIQQMITGVVGGAPPTIFRPGAMGGI